MSQKFSNRVWIKEATHSAPVPLGGELGAGGEGAVYTIRDRPDLVAKIYHPERRTSDVVKKLELMIQYPPRTEDERSGRLYVAWPRSLAYDKAGNVIGFIMPKVNKRNSLYDYYNPSMRKKNARHVNYASLCKVARSLAKSLDELHGRGYVVGDINESNAYVVEDDHVTLIDSDSFQVTDYQSTPNTIYRCTVGKPEYTPPQLQGISFKSIDRAPVHDRFALAVVIYQLLMEGRHPFRGKYKGAGEPPTVESNISQGYFLHSELRDGMLTPIPASVPWDSLHPSVKDLFARCFDDGHANPQARPEPKEWVSVLEQSMKDLSRCIVNTNHWYFNSGNATCTWCARPIEAFPRQFRTAQFVPNSLHGALPPSQNVAPTATPPIASHTPGPVQAATPSAKKSTKRLPPPSYGPIARHRLPGWVKSQIESIRKRPVQGDAGDVVVHSLKGKRYRYKLEFPVVKNWWKRDLGPVTAYRKPRTWFWKRMNKSGF